MSFDFHSNRDKYFNLQKTNTDKYIIPFIEQFKKIESSLKVLEVGCRDGGVLHPFLQRGCYITGVELSPNMLLEAKKRYSDNIERSEANFIAMDIHDFDSSEKFDIIILKDVIEHVYHHDKLIKKLKTLMSSDGVIYFGYPPWQNPYGGHQQVANNKILSKIPYYHLLPNFLYYGILKLAKEKSFKFLKATKETRISIEGFRKYMSSNGLTIWKEELYLINPMYEAKFGIKPRKQFRLIAAIPYFRNYLTTTSDCLVISNAHNEQLLSEKEQH
ncbi:MAG: SAM-dependent methyltransferase [Urechidicola sp.]|jgi:SAM-dependent methyltransferase